MNIKVLFGLAFFAVSGWAYAQTACPMGVQPGDPRCGPSPETAAPSTAMTPPPVVWDDRWGTIAIDFTVGKIGVSKEMRSRRKAEKAAMSECKSNGGKECKVGLTYRNQCAVMAWGNSYATTHGAATIEQASENAIKSCSEHTDDCQIYYAGCSYPVRIQ